MATSGKDKQIVKARETLEVYAPLAHRLGIESVRWELEDLAFATLHPRKYAEVQRMVSQRRADRERDMEEARAILGRELAAVSIEAEISGRAKHFYSIYDKMSRKGKEFNEIYDLTALRVLVSSVKDCYAALGIIHSLWKPLPGRFKDYIAMPKFNMYQSLHTTVIGPQGKPLEIQIRTLRDARDRPIRHRRPLDVQGERTGWAAGRGADREAPVAATDHGLAIGDQRRRRVHGVAAGRPLPRGSLRVHSQGRGEEPAGRIHARRFCLRHPHRRWTPLRRGESGRPHRPAHVSPAVRGHRGDPHLEDRAGAVPRLAAVRRELGARNKIRQWFKRERREDAEHLGREALLEAFRKQGLPAQKLIGSDLLAEIMKESGHQKREDFFVAVGSGKISPQHVVHSRDPESQQEAEKAAGAALAVPTSAPPKETRSAPSSNQLGIHVDGVEDVAIRIPQCCRPVPGDDVVGYISLGRGITVHRRDCPNVKALEKNPERFTTVDWDTHAKGPLRVEIQVEAYDRNRLLEDISRTLSESGVSIMAAQIHTARNNMVKDRFVFDVPDVEFLETVLQRVRRIDTVYDAYRVTPR